MSTHGNPPAARVELYGASNLWLSRGAALAAVRRRFEGPLEIGLACGPGRSYGLRAGNPLVRYLPLREVRFPFASTAPTLAILTDIGNDLVYSQTPETAAWWVRELAERLEREGAEVVVTGLPVESLRGLPRWLFLLLRWIYYSRRELAHQEIMQRLEDLDGKVQELARQRGYLYLPTDPGWYGVDRFHLRAAAYERCWSSWWERLRPGSSPAALPAIPWRSLWRIRAANDWYRGQPRQSAGEYPDVLPDTRLLVR